MRDYLHEANLAMNDVVKVTIYLKHIADFAAINDVYQMFFEVPRPARACIEVSDLPHVGDKPLLVEMDAIAYKASDA
jgi:2-iminobutanoate/2-iminopropanoate deaminase